MDTTSPPSLHAGACVVGVDGSEDSRAAVAWASHHAEVEGLPLVLLHAADATSVYARSAVAGVAFDPTDLVETALDTGRALCGETRARVAAEHADLDVTTHVTRDDPRQALLLASEHAALVVVGSHGRGPVASLVLGSVAVAVSRHASSPLVVVRRGQLGAGHAAPVVVAVDAAPDARPVLEFAFRHASAHGRSLTVLHSHPDLLAMAYGIPTAVPANEGEASLALAQTLAGFGEKFPDVPVHRELRGQLPTDALLQLAEQASLLVVGRKHRTGLRGVFHAGPTTTVVERASCPVAVVPVP